MPGPKPVVQVRLTAAQHARVKARAALAGNTVSGWVRALLRKALEQQREPSVHSIEPGDLIVAGRRRRRVK